ncbi:hypothetical protein BCR37DRAFT_380536 [Protomyces lactucae-debilis]|uniref:Uncharacterized protein n=1 Tax=Protomyces lactucae-debilis TaxID=2754530 RepID=A0A1Y2FD70_PROLT|nr:uncharacterized protein BCR37DRAFT_380536 [Protomyces lactucae-debilis]ORY80795.1 hypothetical protein BCR37DRAFT_380536 [Protomyces lactucae-debilis]
MISVGLDLTGHAAAHKCPEGLMWAPGKRCQQIRNCEFYAMVRNTSDLTEREETWKQLRGQIAPDNDKLFDYKQPDHTEAYTHSFGSNGKIDETSIVWTPAVFTCWRARTEQTLFVRYEINSQRLSKTQGDGTLFQGWILCNVPNASHKAVHCCSPP